METFDLSPDSGREICDGDIWIIGRKEVRLGFVGQRTFVNYLEGLSWREEGFIVIDWEVFGIFVLGSEVSSWTGEQPW